MIVEIQSEAIKNRIILHILSTICYMQDVPNKVNKNLFCYNFRV